MKNEKHSKLVKKRAKFNAQIKVFSKVMTGKGASSVVSQKDPQEINDDEDDDDDSSITSKPSSTTFDEDLSDDDVLVSDPSILSTNEDQKSKKDEEKYMRDLMSFRKDEL